jgi:hypothetical protein
MPYKASYSSNFKMGDAKHVSIVMRAWKIFEENKLDENNPILADTISLELSDGRKVKGRHDFYNTIKQIRDGATDLKVSMVAFMGVKPLDRDGDVVLIWLTESYTTKDGQKGTMDIHQVWGFNKAGKVDFLKTFESKTSM